MLPPSTRQFDLFGKLDEYKTVKTLRFILLVDTFAPRAALWSRDDEAWLRSSYYGMESGIDLPALQVALPIIDIYDQLTFPP